MLVYDDGILMSMYYEDCPETFLGPGYKFFVVLQA